MSHKTRIFLISISFAITFISCVEVAAHIAGKGILPASMEYRNGYPNDYLVYALILAAIVSFGFGVFTMIKNKIVALIITVVGLLLISLLTFIAGVSQANIGY